MPVMRAALASPDEAVARIGGGEMVVVVDDEDRENEGDLTMAAEFASPESINFMIRWARGLVCMPSPAARLDALGFGPMVARNTSAHETAFTVSVDHVTAGSGISARDRSTTIRAVVDEASSPSDFVRPGHVFPLRARSGGVLERAGHTEAAVDLCRLAGLSGVGVICEILDDDGAPARLPWIRSYAHAHGLAIVSIASLAESLTVLSSVG